MTENVPAGGAPPRLELYWGPGNCSFVAHYALERIKARCGVGYSDQKVELPQQEHFTPAFLALNPRHQVPVLRVDGHVVTQLQAVVDCLDTLFPAAGLLPPPGPRRWQAVSTFGWMNSTVHPNHGRLFHLDRTGGTEGAEAVRAVARRTFEAALVEIEQMCASARPFLFGEEPTVTDAYVLINLRWARQRGVELAAFPAYRDYAMRMSADDVVASTLRKEGIGILTDEVAAA